MSQLTKVSHIAMAHAYRLGASHAVLDGVVIYHPTAMLFHCVSVVNVSKSNAHIFTNKQNLAGFMIGNCTHLVLIEAKQGHLHCLSFRDKNGSTTTEVERAKT